MRPSGRAPDQMRSIEMIPGFALHALPAGGRLVSHTVASGQYAGPYPFHDGGQLID